MTENQAQRLIDMISDHWKPVGSAAAAWMHFLTSLSAEAGGKAYSYLVTHNQYRPTILEFKEVVDMQGVDAKDELVAGVCQTCNDDKVVLVSLRPVQRTQFMERREIEPPEEATIEEYAPCPTCATTVKAAYLLESEGRWVHPPDPATVERLMQ